MTSEIDPVELAQALIAAPSVTPAMGAVFDVLEAALIPLGFTVERFIDGIEPDGPVENLIVTGVQTCALPISALRDIWMSCRRASAGPATPSRLKSAASCSMAAAPST